MFDKIDTDAIERISKDEMTAYYQEIGASTAMVEPMFAAWDKNQDGLSMEELTPNLNETLKLSDCPTIWSQLIMIMPVIT